MFLPNHDLFSKVLAGLPKRTNGQGLHVLNFMLMMSNNINEAFTDMWDNVLPRMIAYLEGIRVFV